MANIRDLKKKKRRKLERSRVSENPSPIRDDSYLIVPFSLFLLHMIKICACFFHAIASCVVTFNNVIPFNRLFTFVSHRPGSEQMVLTEQNSACSNEVSVAKNIISKIHNMHWLKNSAVSDQHSYEVKMGKNKSRKPKSAGRGQTTGQDASTSNYTSGPSGTVCNGDKKTAGSLFLNANAESTQPLDEDEQLKQVLEESRKMYEETLQKTKNLRIQEDEDIDNDYWNKKQSNLPNPEPEKAVKSPDTNNNSSGKTGVVAQSHDCPPGRSVMGRKNGNNEKSVQRIEKAVGGNIKLESIGRGKLFEQSFNGVSGRPERHITAQHSGLSEPALRMDQQKSQAASNCSILRDYTEFETHDSRRNERRSHDNRESTFNHRQPMGYLQNTGRESIWRDKYHYVREQPQVQRESDERSSSNNHEKQEISKTISTSYESSKAGELNRDTMDKYSHREQTPKLRILKNDRNPDVVENSPKQPIEKLRLTGFHSRLNRPPPDDEDSASSTSKPEITSPAIASDGFTEKLETPQSSGIIYNAPPGFSHPQPLYSRNEASVSNLASNPNSQHVYENLAIHDPLLHRLLIQKQMSDQPLAENREVIVGYENYQQEEEDQVTMVQPFLIPEHQTYVYPQSVPPGYVLMYCPNQRPPSVDENSLSGNIDYVNNRPNVQMASKAVSRVVTPRGTAPSQRPPASVVPAPLLMAFPPQFQGQYFENSYENLDVPECSLATHQLRANARFSVPPGREQYATLPANLSFPPVSHGLKPGFPQPYGPQFVKHHSRGPPIAQYDEANNVGYQPFDQSHGNTNIPRNFPSPVNRDPRQLYKRPQPMPNMDRAREKLPQTR